MKLTIEELIQEVRENLRCYEDLEKNTADDWEKQFREWLRTAKKKNSKSIREEKGKLYFVLQDEDEVMELADSYYDAVIEHTIKNYWKDFH